MDTYKIDADQRFIARHVRASMQGDVIRVLVELITNCDDSYGDLDDIGVDHSGLIEILYQKESYTCRFVVRDCAEGMSRDEIRAAFGE